MNIWWKAERWEGQIIIITLWTIVPGFGLELVSVFSVYAFIFNIVPDSNGREILDPGQYP